MKKMKLDKILFNAGVINYPNCNANALKKTDKNLFINGVFEAMLNGDSEAINELAKWLRGLYNQYYIKAQARQQAFGLMQEILLQYDDNAVITKVEFMKQIRQLRRNIRKQKKEIVHKNEILQALTTQRMCQLLLKIGNSITVKELKEYLDAKTVLPCSYRQKQRTIKHLKVWQKYCV